MCLPTGEIGMSPPPRAPPASSHYFARTGTPCTGKLERVCESPHSGGVAARPRDDDDGARRPPLSRRLLANPEGGGDGVVPGGAVFQRGSELYGVDNVVGSAGDVHVFSLTPATCS